jgi:hypothetical protein
VNQNSFENGQRVVCVDYLGNEVYAGRVRSGDNYPESNDVSTWVTVTTSGGVTITEEWPTKQLQRAR